MKSKLVDIGNGHSVRCIIEKPKGIIIGNKS